MEFSNRKPLTEDEKSGRVGPRASGGRIRREARKVLSELRGLMHMIEDLVREAGTFEEVITPSSVDRMFFSVSRQFQEEDHNSRDCRICGSQCMVN